MDDAQKIIQNPNPVPATPPTPATPPAPKASVVSDIPAPPVGSVLKEQGPVTVSEVLKPAETAPDISPDVAPFVQPSQVQVPPHQIIKAAGENTPVTFEPTGIVELPSIEESRQILKGDKNPNHGIVWIAEETVREDDRTKVIHLSKELEDLKKAA